MLSGSQLSIFKDLNDLTESCLSQLNDFLFTVSREKYVLFSFTSTLVAAQTRKYVNIVLLLSLNILVWPARKKKNIRHYSGKSSEHSS